MEVFCVTRLGGLYLEGFIHGGAYSSRNFTVVLSGVGKNDSRNRNKTFFSKRKCKFSKKWLPKIGSHSSINVAVHVTTTLKCSQINFAKFGGLTSTVLLNVIQFTRVEAGLNRVKQRIYKFTFKAIRFQPA